MIKMDKQRYFDVSFSFIRESWGVLGCPRVIRLTVFNNIFSGNKEFNYYMTLNWHFICDLAVKCVFFCH